MKEKVVRARDINDEYLMPENEVLEGNDIMDAIRDVSKNGLTIEIKV